MQSDLTHPGITSPPTQNDMARARTRPTHEGAQASSPHTQHQGRPFVSRQACMGGSDRDSKRKRPAPPPTRNHTAPAGAHPADSSERDASIDSPRTYSRLPSTPVDPLAHIVESLRHPRMLASCSDESAVCVQRPPDGDATTVGNADRVLEQASKTEETACHSLTFRNPQAIASSISSSADLPLPSCRHAEILADRRLCANSAHSHPPWPSKTA